MECEQELQEIARLKALEKAKREGEDSDDGGNMPGKDVVGN